MTVPTIRLLAFRAVLATAVSMAVLAGQVAPARAATQATAPEATQANTRVVVDASALGSDADAVQGQVREGVVDLLQTNRITVVTDAAAPEVLLTVSPIGGDTGYRCKVEIRMDGATVQGTQGVSDCRLCTESELVETAQATVETQLERLRELGTPKAAPAVTSPVAEPPASDDGDPLPASDGGGPDAADECEGDNPPKRCTAPLPPTAGGDKGLTGMGKAGAGVLAVGGAALVSGIVLAVLPPTPLPDAMRRTTTIPGIGLAAGGGAAVIAGVVMIVLGRKSRKTARVMPTGLFAPGIAGAGLRGRF